jgi:hypothetical protein
MHAMVEEEVDQDSPEVYDEAYYDQVDYAHMAFHIPQNEVDDACFQSRSSAPVSSRNHTVPHVTLITEHTTDVTSPAVASALPSVTTAPAHSADTRGIILFLLAVIIFLVIPDRLHAAAVSSCVCLVTHFPYINSSLSSAISSVSAYTSSMSSVRTYKLSFASLCVI